MVYKSVDSPVDFKGFRGVYLLYALACLVLCILCIIVGTTLLRGTVMLLYIIVFMGITTRILSYFRELSKKDYHYFSKKASCKNALFT